VTIKKTIFGARQILRMQGVNVKRGLIIVAATSLFHFTIAQAGEITILASGATKEVIAELIPQFEKTSGNKVTITWTGTANIKKRIAAGEVYDLVIVGGPVIDAFSKEGKVVPGSRVDLMKSGVGVAVRTGAPKPDIGSSEALKKNAACRQIDRLFERAKRGLYGKLERMGIADQVKTKMKQVPSGTRISTMIESGDAEIGFQQISELIHEKGIDYLGPLPSDVQKITVFSAGLHAGAKESEAAKALVKALTGPDAAPVIKQHGMEPG
jgi:molybdate transport system substrate-binding protein